MERFSVPMHFFFVPVVVIAEQNNSNAELNSDPHPIGRCMQQKRKERTGRVPLSVIVSGFGFPVKKSSSGGKTGVDIHDVCQFDF
jgi:hypothetical protein